MYIQHNMAAMEANHSLKRNQGSKLKSLEKLSTGYQINRAADNAAGLTISEKMRAQIRGLNQAERNIQDGIGFVQTAEGALSEIQDMMHRIHELAVQAANDTNTPEDRECLDDEIQMYKEEIDYMFRETEFNTIKIWDTHTNNKVQIGIERRQALKLQSFSSKTFRVTETNKGAIAYSGYTIQVQGTDSGDPATYGFKVSWEGWNKKQYSSKLISWDEATAGRTFGMNLSDHIDLDRYPELKGIDFRIAWTAEETAAIDDIAASIDGVRFSSGESSSESTKLNQTSPGVSFSISTSYLAELASDRNVDAYDTAWMEPAPTGTTNVITQPSYTNPQENTGWKIHFTMPNIGLVTASSYDIDYYSNDSDADAEGLWWRWVKPVNASRYKSTLLHGPDRGNGNLLGVTDCITDSAGNGDSLTKNAKGSGMVRVYFDIKKDSGNFEYEGRQSNYIGSMTMSIAVSHNDTEESIMNKVKAALNRNTIFDVFEGNEKQGTPYTTYGYVYSASARQHLIDTPVYKTNHDRVIQAGANAGQLIHICYDSLRLMNLGIQDSNVLTRKEATQTIAAVQSASEIISGQRSLFGAYQNRMEHAKEVDAGTAENLQAAESRIRDADMADEMVNNARVAIMEQSMQAMLASANRQVEGVLNLLEGR